jgi:DNA-binding FrmR family transcriptional regulator
MEVALIPPGGILAPPNHHAGTHAESAIAMSTTDRAISMTEADAQADGPLSHEGHEHAVATDADAFRHSYSRDKAQLIRRLSRIEGQVRGISRMIDREEYCVDILQQTSALRSAVDALAVLILEDHVQGCVRTAAERGQADEYVQEVLEVVRRTLGRPSRSTARTT